MEYEYDIVISFAGEDRTLAKEISQKLKAHGIKVFYDEDEEAELWGQELSERLHDIYSKKARFCLMIISAAYKEKMWTIHERRSAQERAMKENGVYILPVRLDDTSLPGHRETVGHFDLRGRSVDQLISTVLRKLNMVGSQRDISTNEKPIEFSIPLPKVKLEFTELDKDRFYKETFQIIKKYFQQGIQELNKINNVQAEFSDMALYRISCVVYRYEKQRSACTIWFGASLGGSASIGYSNQANQESSNSMNEILTVEVGRDTLTLRALLDNFGSGETQKMPSTKAAEYLWEKFIAPLEY